LLWLQGPRPVQGRSPEPEDGRALVQDRGADQRAADHLGRQRAQVEQEGCQGEAAVSSTCGHVQLLSCKPVVPDIYIYIYIYIYYSLIQKNITSLLA